MPNDCDGVWVWDLLPLAPKAWPSRRIKTDVPPGGELKLSERKSPRATGPWAGKGGGGYLTLTRKGYRPTADDLAILRRAFPDADPEQPSWPNIRGKLLLANLPAPFDTPDNLAKLSPPELLGALEKVLSDDQAPAEHSGAADADELPERVKTARDQYTQACESLGKDSPTDREVYDLLTRTYHRAGQVSPLPAFGTWTSYLRQWRRTTGRQKSKSRGIRQAEAGSLKRKNGSVMSVSRPAGASRSIVSEHDMR